MLSSIFEPDLIAGLFDVVKSPYLFGSSFVIQDDFNNCIDLQLMPTEIERVPKIELTFPGALSYPKITTFPTSTKSAVDVAIEITTVQINSISPSMDPAVLESQ